MNDSKACRKSRMHKTLGRERGKYRGTDVELNLQERYCLSMLCESVQ